MVKTSLAVGLGAPNSRSDVLTIQSGLNQHVQRLGLLPLRVDGHCGIKTLTAIREFQKRILRLPKPDGRVDPNGHTFAKLSEPAPASGPVTPADTILLAGTPLPDAPAKVLKQILRGAGLTRATVTSVVRTPADQARVMYDKIAKNGLKYSYHLYAAAGREVTKVFEDNEGQPRAAVVALMETKIKALGPSRVSKHCSSTHYVFDVNPLSITAKDAFIHAVNGHKAVTKFLQPPQDEAYHLEIPKDSPYI
jgi:peptidoglycan hydrolase-like protein with peptidoglycan-binding domain